jgi:hypothetical protein
MTDPKDEACVLDGAYGVFVASGADLDGGSPASEAGISAGDGTTQHPFGTIAEGLAHLEGKSRVYVCNGVYNEQVSITTAVSVYGGLSCAGTSSGRVWSYVGQSAQVSSPSPAYALSVAAVDGGSVTIEDLSFAAPDATKAGASSLAALIASSTVNFRRVTLIAGKGANGANGADGFAHPNYTGTAPDGGEQAVPGPPDSGAFVAAAGAGAINQCMGFGLSVGGQGGVGCASGPGNPGLGTPGTATPPPPPILAGRDGQPRGAILADGGTVANNDPGADGLAGAGGVPAQDYGTLSPSGWSPSAGGDGDPGGPAQGGAGATDPIYGSCGSPEGLGGGGGGAGGCGGSGGQGGGGGGASVALASVASTLDLAACTLVAAAGGIGGAGGSGQDGQAGGAGGDANRLASHAAGASGGDGAGGSGGAGGTGGISVDLLDIGSTITSDMATTQNARAGVPGLGGPAGMPGKHGAGVVLATGMDGHSGAPGRAGTAASRLDLVSP